MFIFILYEEMGLETPALIYIPLCLYLYDRKIFVVDINGEFTFHYVYIYMLLILQFRRQ